MNKTEEPKSGVTFETPPPKRTQRYDWAKIRDELTANPNEWAKVFDDDLSSLAHAIRSNGIVAMRKDRGIEIRTTNNVRTPQRRCTLWARYVPENDTTLNTDSEGTA